MKIAVFDYQVNATNAIGGCHQRMMAALCEEHDFVVVAVEFDNPRPDRIVYVATKIPTRPLVLLFVTFHLFAGRAWRRHQLNGRGSVDIRQGVESNIRGAEIIYAQFCHRAYLKHSGGFSREKLLDIRLFLRWLDHRFRAWMEPMVYRNARHIVVPSVGLARELAREYPYLAGKITVISNPIDVAALQTPLDFTRADHRHELGLADTDTVLIFTALGHFERKGLPILMDAIAAIGHRDLKLVVVGGEVSLVQHYKKRAATLGIEKQIVFVGRQSDVRRFLWLADAFVFPSEYETFSLSTYEAAAAGLPIIVTRLHGVEDFTRDHENAFVIDRNVIAVRAALEELVAMSPDRRFKMGQSARHAVSSFTVDRFSAAWREFYHEVEAHSVKP